METITVNIYQEAVYEEVAKATDYTGSKMIDADADARERILAVDEDLSELGRFWDEAVLATNENLKEMLVSGQSKQLTGSATPRVAYEAVIEVSKSFDKNLTASVQTTLRSFFISTIIGQWFKFANKQEAGEYFAQSAEFMTAAERLLYSRRKPTVPKNT